MPEDVAGDLPVSARVVIPGAELRWRFSRSSGPGGQSVNTTDSRVELEWDWSASAALTDQQKARFLARHPAGVVVVRAAEQRSQRQNRRAARQRLADLVRAALAPPPRPRRRTRPTRSATERRLAAKRRRSAVKAHRTRPTGDD